MSESLDPAISIFLIFLLESDDFLHLLVLIFLLEEYFAGFLLIFDEGFDQHVDLIHHSLLLQLVYIARVLLSIEVLILFRDV